MKYKKYPQYKDSGVEWLGEIPENWLTTKVKYKVPYQVGWTPPTKVSENFDGKNKWVTIADLKNRIINTTKSCISDVAAEQASMNITPKGSLLFSFKLSVGIVAFAGENLYTNEAIASFLKNENSSIHYLYYASPLFIVKNASENIYGAKILNQELISNATLVLPSLEEQQTIANYLDKATVKIDTLIEKQAKLIELLKEKRQAIISTAVTRGLDSSVPMKDSGVEWLGEIPEHWVVKKFKYSARIQGGKDQKEVLNDNGEYPVYGSGGIFGYANKYLYNGKSVLLGRKGTVDKPLYVQGAFWTVDTMYYTILKNITVPKWFYYTSTTIKFDYYQYGSAIPSMTQEDLHNIYFSTPSKKEQQKIATYLDYKTSKIDKLTRKSMKCIDLLKEKRTVLINSAVTGKIDVREIA